MSRIRTIKPEIWTSEQIVLCSRDARLLFIGLLNFCDDAGVHPASHLRLKMEVFPGDNCTLNDIKKWMGELIQNNLLREYSVGDETYWIVTGWNKHQKIDKPTYRHPLPNSDLKKITDQSTNVQQEVDNNSTTTRRVIEDHSATPQKIVEALSVTESNGKEGNGKEINICEVETSPGLVSEINGHANNSSKNSNHAQEVFFHWQQIMNHPRAKYDKKRQRLIQQALDLGYNVEELKQAIEGCKSNAYNMGKNEHSQIYDSINLIFRDADHIDRFIGNATNTSNTNTSGVPEWMKGVI